MKFNSAKKYIQSTVLAIILSFNHLSAMSQLPEIQTDSNLSCMMGGVGLDESQAMREEAKNGLLPLSLQNVKEIHMLG
jgi:hypothetical protein